MRALSLRTAVMALVGVLISGNAFASWFHRYSYESQEARMRSKRLLAPPWERPFDAMRQRRFRFFSMDYLRPKLEAFKAKATRVVTAPARAWRAVRTRFDDWRAARAARLLRPGPNALLAPAPIASNAAGPAKKRTSTPTFTGRKRAGSAGSRWWLRGAKAEQQSKLAERMRELSASNRNTTRRWVPPAMRSPSFLRPHAR